MFGSTVSPLSLLLILLGTLCSTCLATFDQSHLRQALTLMKKCGLNLQPGTQ
jgi:hypothetical protein